EGLRRGARCGTEAGDRARVLSGTLALRARAPPQAAAGHREVLGAPRTRALARLPRRAWSVAMNLHAPGRADALGAEYVLGTLRGSAGARFERLVHTDPVLAEAVRRWEERLVPLAQELPPVAPPARVWQGILRRTRGDTRGAPAAKPRASIWANLGLWRGLAL